MRKTTTKPTKTTANPSKASKPLAATITQEANKAKTAKAPETPKPGRLKAALTQRRLLGAPHLIIIARAGTGKTTTLVEGLRVLRNLPTKITPSPQQAVIWESMKLSKDAKTVGFVAFNKSIADELNSRVPQGCDAMTMHSMGNRAIRKVFPAIGKPDKQRVLRLLAATMGCDMWDLRSKRPVFVQAVEQLVGLCKLNLAGPCHVLEAGEEYSEEENQREMQELVKHYDIDLGAPNCAQEVYSVVAKVIDHCTRLDVDCSIDFNDMIWLPVALNLPIFKYDLLLIDEAQDLNKCQQALTQKAGNRLIYCGDPKQAIYGFAGADTEGINRLSKVLHNTPAGCKVLPLTVTRRCGKAIVKEAQKYVPDFEAFKTNSEGVVSRASFPTATRPGYVASVCDGDMVLCRVNAPLVSECFRFIRSGRKANIQGRDIGEGLIRLIKSFKAETIANLCEKIDTWHEREVEKLSADRKQDEAKIINLDDKAACLRVFTENAKTIEEVIAAIEKVFSDEDGTKGIRLSSVHKAKGLEAHRVFILQPKGATMPHPLAKSSWEKEQELNILYVAITRAIEELVYVS